MSAQMPNCSMEEIAARVSQYLEGEIEAAEFRDKLLHAIAHADQGAGSPSRRPSPTTPRKRIRELLKHNGASRGLR
jgi:hypothetical protein